MASTWRNNSLTRRLHQVPARIVLRHCVHIKTYGTEAAMEAGRLLGQLTRMHDDKTQCLLCDAPITVFDLHLTEYTLAMPAPRDLVASPPGLLEQEWEGRLLLPPAFECLADGTGARDERDEVDLMLETHAQCAATTGLTIRDDPTHSLQAQGQTFFNRHTSLY